MKDALGIDPLIVQQLREAAAAGKSATQLLALWQSAASQSDDCRMDMFQHFHEAFMWGPAERAALGAWSHFGDSAWTDEMIDVRYVPLLEAWRKNPSPYPIPEVEFDMSLNFSPLSDAEIEYIMQPLEI